MIKTKTHDQNQQKKSSLSNSILGRLGAQLGTIERKSIFISSALVGRLNRIRDMTTEEGKGQFLELCFP